MDLNTMMREQARNGLEAQLDAAVTNGDAEAARKVTEQIAQLAVATAPKPNAYGNDEIKAELDKQPWFGTDPKKSARAVELGKSLDPKKFPSAAAFAEALVKVVDEEFKPATDPNAGGGDTDDDDTDDDKDGNKKDDAPRKKRTDGPGPNDALGARRGTGPWTKLSDAPADIQKEIRRQADKFVASNATKEQREKFERTALESHYKTHQRKQGKK